MPRVRTLPAYERIENRDEEAQSRPIAGSSEAVEEERQVQDDQHVPEVSEERRVGSDGEPKRERAGARVKENREKRGTRPETELPAEREERERLDRQESRGHELHPVLDRELKEAQRIDGQVEERRIRERDPTARDILETQEVAVLVLDMVREETGEPLGPDERDELRVGPHVGIVEVRVEEREKAYRKGGDDNEDRPSSDRLRKDRAWFPAAPDVEERKKKDDDVRAKAERHRRVDRPQFVREGSGRETTPRLPLRTRARPAR